MNELSVNIINNRSKKDKINNELKDLIIKKLDNGTSAKEVLKFANSGFVMCQVWCSQSPPW